MESSINPVALLPKRPQGNYANRFEPDVIISNHYKVFLEDIKQIVVFDYAITPSVEFSNEKKLYEIWSKVESQVCERIKNPVYRKKVIYSQVEYKEPFEVSEGEFRIKISQRKAHNVSSKPVLLMFLNNALRGIMNRLDYTEIDKSGKYLTLSKLQKIDNLKMYKGFSAAFQELEEGIFLRVDTARKIVRKDTVLECINTLYQVHSGKDKEEKRNEVKKALVNAIIMTTYGKHTFYRILDV